MNLPATIVASEWEFLATSPTILTAATVAQLTRGLYEPEIVVDSITLCQYTGAATTVTVRRLPSGGSEGGSHNQFTAMPIAASETILLPEQGQASLNWYLQPGEAIKALAADATRVTMTINYRKRR